MSLTIYIISNAKTAALYALTQQAVKTAWETTPEGTQIVVYEQNPTASYGSGLRGDPWTFPNTDNPFNYSRACNWCVEDCETEFIGIFNNDVIFYPHWWFKMKKTFKYVPDLMAASPRCEIRHGRPRVTEAPAYGYTTGTHVCGWALVFRKSLIDIIGPFDENLEFWCSDSDYGRRLEKHGVKNALIPTARVDHLESKTLKTIKGAEYQRLTAEQNKKYRKKWGLK